MMFIKSSSTFILVIAFIGSIWSQDANRLKEIQEIAVNEDTDGWVFGLGAGLDFFQFMQLNPRIGSGENRIQIGGVGTIMAQYKDGRFNWNNAGSLLFGVQKLGIGTADAIAFQKTIDEVRLTSLASYKTAEKSQWAYGADFTILTQLTPTYFGNYLKKVDSGADYDGPLSKFLSPAQITFSPGFSWVPSDKFSLLYSPVSIKAIIVADDDIASIPGDADKQIGLHGTEWKSPTDYKNLLFQLGSTLKAAYSNKFFNDKIIYTSELTLFSNYLHKPKNIDIDFRNQIAYEIWKGLQLTFTLNFFYDDDILVQITDKNSPEGVKLHSDGTPKLGKRLNVVETFVLKYNIVF